MVPQIVDYTWINQLSLIHPLLHQSTFPSTPSTQSIHLPFYTIYLINPLSNNEKLWSDEAVGEFIKRWGNLETCFGIIWEVQGVNSVFVLRIRKGYLLEWNIRWAKGQSKSKHQSELSWKQAWIRCQLMCLKQYNLWCMEGEKHVEMKTSIIKTIQFLSFKKFCFSSSIPDCGNGQGGWHFYVWRTELFSL